MTDPDDHRFMQLALSLGRRGLGNTWPNPAVGAVVVKDGMVLGRGWTQPGGRPHAETVALRRAGEAARGASLYVTLEPCSHHGKTPPCADAIIAAGIARVICAIEDPNPEVAGKGYARLRAAGIDVVTGVCEEEARRAHAGHIRRIVEGRPHVTLKLAVSLDDKVGLPGRRPARITGEETRARVHLMRAMNDALLTGIGTVLSDDPELNCRLPGMAAQSPVRVVLDSSLRLPATSKLAMSAERQAVWVFCDERASADRETSLASQGVIVQRIARAGEALDLGAALQALAVRGITRLMVEAGPRISSAFVRSDLVDEAWIMRGPSSIGPGGIDALDGLELSALTGSQTLHRVSASGVDDDIHHHFERR